MPDYADYMRPDLRKHVVRQADYSRLPDYILAETIEQSVEDSCDAAMNRTDVRYLCMNHSSAQNT